MIKCVCGVGRLVRASRPRSGEWHCRIVLRNSILLRQCKLTGDVRHLRMLATPACVGLELRGHVAAIQPGEAGGTRAVSAAVEAVTREAGVGCTGITTAQGNQFTGCGETVG
jgi:hypothetical protein